MSDDNIVAKIKKVAVVDTELAGVAERVRKFIDRSSRSQRRHADGVAAWKARAREALEKGEDFSELPPTEPISAPARRLYLDGLKAEQDVLRGARLRAVVESATEIESDARKAVERGVKKAFKALDGLNDALVDVRAGQVAVDEVAAAKRALDSRRPRPSNPPSLYSVRDLFEAVMADRDPLAGWQPERRLGFIKAAFDRPQLEPKPERSGPEQGETVTVVPTNSGAGL